MRVEYPWHAAAGVEVEVLYREQRRGEVVFICRMPDGTGEVVPAWMFDAAALTTVSATWTSRVWFAPVVPTRRYRNPWPKR